MSVYRRKGKNGGTWAYRTGWLTHPLTQEKTRLSGTAKKWGLSNSKAGASEAERRARSAFFASVTGSQKCPTWADFLDEWHEHERSRISADELAKNRQLARDYFLPFFQDRPLDQTTTKVQRAFQRWLSDTHGHRCSLRYQHAVFGKVRRVLSAAKECGYISTIEDCDGVWCPPTRPRYLDFDELELLLRDETSEIWGMMLVASKTGLRPGEMRALEKDHLDRVNRSINVTASQSRKRGRPNGRVKTNGSMRSVPVPELAWDVLMRAYRDREGPFLFGRYPGKSWDRTSVQRLIKETAEAVGLERVTWHTMRHTYAAHLAMLGVPLPTLAELLGHSLLETTRLYVHIANRAKRSAVNLLDRVAQTRHSEDLAA